MLALPLCSACVRRAAARGMRRCAELLILGGADMNVLDKKGRNPEALALELNQREVYAQLVKERTGCVHLPQAQRTRSVAPPILFSCPVTFAPPVLAAPTRMA